MDEERDQMHWLAGWTAAQRWAEQRNDIYAMVSFVVGVIVSQVFF
jgi:hypothetical protein